MRLYPSRFIALLLFATFLFVSEAPTLAATPSDTAPPTTTYGETTLHLAGLARTRLATQHTSAEGIETPQASLVMARLRAQAVHEGAGLVNIELDMALPMRILDLYSEVDLGSPISVRVGLFKVPLSREMQMPIVSHPIFERSLLNLDLGVRRRVGATVAASFELGAMRGNLQTGVFNPTMTFNEGLNDGMLWTSAFDLEFDTLHTDLHIAYMEHVLAPGERIDPVTMAPLFPHDHQLDVELYHERGAVRALAEALVAFDNRITGDDTPVWALHALIAYELRALPSQEGGHGLEPALSVDYLSLEDGDHLRVTGNLNWLIVSRKLLASIAYGFEPELGAQQPARSLGLLQLQGSF